MDGCEDRVNSVLVLEPPLVQSEMEEWLATNPPFAASEDGTNGSE